MCSILGLSGIALIGVLIAGALSLGYNLVQIYKAGVAYFKHKLNLDEPKPAV